MAVASNERPIAPDIDLARTLFDRLDRGTREGAGIVRDSYGAGEQFAHDAIGAAARDLGLRVERDAALNLFMTLAGRDPSAPRVLVGSHLDSVNQGGNFDGAAGVISGLAAVAGLIHAGATPPVDVTVLAIRAEESVWFDSPYVGSLAALGRLDPAHLDTVRRSDTGRTLADHMAEQGADLAAVRAGRALVEPSRVGSYLEVHIEQGPLLIGADVPVGVVTGIRGCARYSSARCLGRYAHSGATPKAFRRDAVLATAEFVARMDEAWSAAEAAGTDICVTVGVFNTDPALAGGSKVAGETRFTLDLRSVSEDTMRDFGRLAREVAGGIGRRHGTVFDLGEPTWSVPAAMDPRIRARLSDICAAQGIAAVEMASGAGHDAAVFASAGIPSGMIFIRNADGSHNPDEAMAMADFEAATRVLMRYLADPLMPGRSPHV